MIYEVYFFCRVGHVVDRPELNSIGYACYFLDKVAKQPNAYKAFDFIRREKLFKLHVSGGRADLVRAPRPPWTLDGVRRRSHLPLL